jgi:PEGA domain-containing protein
MKTLAIVVLSLMLFVAATCGANRTSLQTRCGSDLKCGMTVNDVREKTRPYAELREDAAGTWRLHEGNLQALLGFSGGTLKTVQYQQYHNESTALDMSPIENLCDGSKSGVLVVSAPLELQGATVYVDDVDAGSLTPTATRLVVAWRPHTVRLEKIGWQPIVMQAAFGANNGFTRVDVDRSALVAR